MYLQNKLLWAKGRESVGVWGAGAALSDPGPAPTSWVTLDKSHNLNFSSSSVNFAPVILDH